MKTILYFIGLKVVELLGVAQMQLIEIAKALSSVEEFSETRLIKVQLPVGEKQDFNLKTGIYVEVGAQIVF